MNVLSRTEDKKSRRTMGSSSRVKFPRFLWIWFNSDYSTLFEKSNFCPKIQFWPKTPTFSRVFRPNCFWQFFSWNQSCQQLKSSKPQHFHEFFTQKNRQFFSGNQSWIFGQKMKIWNSVWKILPMAKAVPALIASFLCSIASLTMSTICSIHNSRSSFSARLKLDL